MTVSYLLVSDLHMHSWSAFSQMQENGVSNRLTIICNEMRRAAKTLRDQGGRVIIIAGDLFHTRGEIKPEVFNTVYALFQDLSDEGHFVYAIPGNHDLSSNDTTLLGNAFLSLGAIEGFNVISEPCRIGVGGNRSVTFLPWQTSQKLLSDQAQTITDEKDRDDLIMHTGVDDVIAIPGHSLSPDDIFKWGYQRVFSGHYHNHKVFENDQGQMVCSIGALTHQKWNDVGTKAGFILVYPDKIKYHATHAPQFVEIDGDTEEEEFPALVDGNYVRVRELTMDDEQTKALRNELYEMGAKGVLLQTVRKTVSARPASVASGSVISIEKSLEEYINKLPSDVDDIRADIGALAKQVLSDAQSIRE